MQKTILAAVLFVLAVSAQAQMDTNAPLPAVYISAADVEGTLKKAPPDSVADQAIRTVPIGIVNVGVAVVHRSAKASQNAIIHSGITEIYHILSGSGTLVTGGTLVNPEPFPEDSPTVRDLAGPSMRGTALEGGVSRKLGPGDVVIIPLGAGHWFSSIDEKIDYLVVRVDPGKQLALK